MYNRPIQTLNQSKSNRSLYTQNSDDSDRNNKIQKQAVNQKVSHRQEPVSQEFNKLPSINPVDKPQRSFKLNQVHFQEKSKSFNQNDSTRKYDGMPTIPIQVSPDRYARVQRIDTSNKNNYLSDIPQGNFNTIGVTSIQRNQFSNPYGMPQVPRDVMRMTGMSGLSGAYPQSNESERSRMMRSSQGGRWLRSQSLMQEKNRSIKSQQQKQNLSNIQILTQNYHRHESRYVKLFQQYSKFYSLVQKILQQKNDIFYKYRLSLSDSVQQIKNKMEIFLESKLDLSNLPIDRPDGDWGQQQLVKFYTNYNQILIDKPQLKIENKEDNLKILTILKKYKNCSYYGPIKQGKKHGFGYLHYFSGRFFQGIFENDQKIKGFEMDDSELFIGQYDKNQRSGEGVLKTNQYLLSGIFTNGQFKLNKSNEQKKFSEQRQQIYRKGFKIEFSNVTFYLGELVVIEKNNNGDVYIGQITEEGQKNGEGLQIFFNGDFYIGRYQQGAPQGYGEYYWSSGAFYRGDFLSGMRHGKGTWMMLHGDRYDGEYLNDKKNGKGTYLWKSGDRYQGQFENDYRHGMGEMYWRDGTSYKGQWLNGIQANKRFKLSNQTEQKQKTMQAITKTSLKQPQTRTRIVKKQQPKNFGAKPKNQQHRTLNVSTQYKSNGYKSEQSKKRVPLEKLKAMLNPSNSEN